MSEPLDLDAITACGRDLPTMLALRDRVRRAEGARDSFRRDLHEILGLIDDPSRDEEWVRAEISGICEQALRRD